MRLLGNLICLSLIAGTLQGQPQVLTGPILGFTSDNDGTAIRPIIGIPGAARQADRLRFDLNIRGVVISPRQDYAIASRVEDSQLLAIDLRTGVPLIGLVAGTHSGTDVAAISPSGSVAAVYDNASKTIQIIGDLPSAPSLVRELDASHIQGRGTGVAVSDDGMVAVIKVFNSNSASLWVIDSSGGFSPILVDQPSAATFLANSHDVIVTDNATHSAFLLLDVAHGANRIPLVSTEDGLNAFSAVSVSEDGRRVFLADADSGNIAIVDMETRRLALLSCQCRAAGFYRLKGTSVFRLTETSREPMTVLDASSTEPRIVVIPPSLSGAEAQ